MEKRKIHILIGLPGSGKSTFAKIYQLNNKRVNIIDVDELREKYPKKVLNCVVTNISNAFQYFINTEVILDGLFLTNQDIDTILITLNNKFKNVDYVLHIWNDDRETCKKNDVDRRKTSSITTINNAIFDKFNLKDIKNRTGISQISIEEHIVKLKPSWMFDLEKKHSVKNGLLYSSSWVTGGTVTGYLSGEKRPIEPDVQPEFDLFDEILEDIYPEITYLQYKKLYKNCVKIETIEDNDYYGSITYSAYYVCDLVRLNIEINNYINKKNERG